MCIISGPVDNVAATHILVAPTVDHRQFTVYANTVAMKDNRGVMILPFPKGGCEFVDLSGYEDLFLDLKSVCPLDPATRGIVSYSNNSRSSDSLAVTQVGSYKASIVPTMADFSRLRSDLFPVQEIVLEFLGQYYQEFSFVVCRLDQNKTYHPFGYLHAPLENRLFIPTMHYHRHSYGVSDGIALHADWDHYIWCMNRSIKNLPDDAATRMNTQRNIQFISDAVDFSKLPNVLEPCRTISGWRIDRYHSNHDLIASA